MPSTIKSSSNFKTVLSAVKKLTAEEKQLLKRELFAQEALAEMKSFEASLKKKKRASKKSDDEIVSVTKAIRRRNYATTAKMLH